MNRELLKSSEGTSTGIDDEAFFIRIRNGNTTYIA